MNILLINPPFFKTYHSYNNRPNVGLHTLKQILEEKGHQCCYLNLDHEYENIQKPLLKRSKIVIESKNLKLEIIDNSVTTILNKVKSFECDAIIYAIGDVVIPSVDFGSPLLSNDINKEVKKNHPQIHTTAYGPFVQKGLSFDLTIFGNAESTINKLLINKDKGYIQVSTDEKTLESVPFLNLDNFEYSVNTSDFDYIWLSRGCPFNCHFCTLPYFSKRKVIHRSPNRFVEEIDYRLETFSINNFYFTDLTFNFNTSLLEETCQLLSDKRIQWRCDCRVELLNKRQIDALSMGNCQFVKLGIESMDSERLTFLGKEYDTGIVKSRIKSLQSQGVGVVVYILLGHPNYSRDQYLKEFDLFSKLGADKYTVSILNPSPGTFLNSELKWDELQLPMISHLNYQVAKYWKIPDNVLKMFYDLEDKCGREDDQIRTYSRKD